MKYFTHISHSLALRNNVEKATYALLTDHERLIIDESDLEAFQEKIITSINEINGKYPRCNPLKPVWYQDGFKGDIHLHSVHLCSFHLYKSKKIKYDATH